MSHHGDSLRKVLWKLVVLSVSCSAVGVQMVLFCSAAELSGGAASSGTGPDSRSTAGERDAALPGGRKNYAPSPLPYSIQKFAGISVAQNNNFQHVTLVDPHGIAAEAGILAGDEIVHAQLNGDELILRMKRNGKPYQASMKLTNSTPAKSSATNKPFELKVTDADTAEDTSHRLPRPGTASQSQQGVPHEAQASANSGANNNNNNNNNTISASTSSNSLLDPQAFNALSPQMAPNRPYNLNANANAMAMQTDRFGRPIVDVNGPGQIPIVDINSPLRILANYQLELIVDQSLSMGKRDCPGGLSRWDWCGVQAADLSRAISSFVPEGLTITPFNEGFRVYKNSNPQDIVTLFQRGKRHWGTELAEPLADRLNSFFKNRNRNPKPLLIAVITDGIPVPQPEPQMVIQELVKATRRMSNPTEVTVVFFQIGGNDRFGHNYLQYLDQNLFKDGARFHLVHTFPFEQLQQIGLANALVQTVRTYGQAR
jgi:hypothetical protein